MSGCSSNDPNRIGDIKVGDSLSIVGILVLPEGDWTARCDIRDRKGVLLESIDIVLGEKVEELTPCGIYFEDTSAWPLGTYFLDVLVFDSTIRVHTDTFSFSVIAGITT